MTDDFQDELVDMQNRHRAERLALLHPTARVEMMSKLAPVAQAVHELAKLGFQPDEIVDGIADYGDVEPGKPAAILMAVLANLPEAERDVLHLLIDPLDAGDRWIAVDGHEVTIVVPGHRTVLVQGTGIFAPWQRTYDREELIFPASGGAS